MGNSFSSKTNGTAAEAGDATGKKFLNDNGANAVEEMLEGMVALHPERFMKLQGENVIVRADFETVKKDQVVLISGGGSGHEPAHAGFCGEAMLTAAVCGGVFASPSMESILKTIRTVTGPKGCLLIIKNYTGDRLNFGLAAEQAKTEGFKVEMVVVGDDAALSSKGVTGRRGVAGTVFVHKVAGAAAKNGSSLEQVLKAAESVASTVRTVGVALSVCNVPGKKLSTRLSPDDGKMELGLGIHGEPGRETLDLLSSKEIVEKMTQIIVDDFKTLDGKKPEKIAVLVNNLGGTTPLEMYGLSKTIMDMFKAAPFNLDVQRMYSAPVMTSLEMQGFSLSILSLDEDAETLIQRLDQDTNAIGWPGSVTSFSPSTNMDKHMNVEIPSPPDVVAEAGNYPTISQEAATLLEGQIRAASQAMITNEPQLTEWDKLCGDGDAGETFQKGANFVLQVLDDKKVVLTSPHLVMAALAEQARKMGGTSGAVLAIFFRAFETSIKNGDSYGAALANGNAAITKYGGATPGMRTMLDSLDAMQNAWTEDCTLDDLAKAALEGAKATAEMKGSAGRSNYVPDEKLKGIPDPGAMAVAFAMQAMAGHKA